MHCARGGVGAGEGLVEEQHVRVVDDGLRELRALAHAAAVAADLAVHGVGQAEALERVLGALLRDSSAE